MMSEATKGNAMVMAILLLGLVLQFGPAHSATYIVGDRKGWNYKIAGWEKGKHFKAGDTLVFKYDPTEHTVVAPVDKSGYDMCASTGAKTYESGNDRLRLSKGPNYFICGIYEHCLGSGMKITVYVD